MLFQLAGTKVYLEGAEADNPAWWHDRLQWMELAISGILAHGIACSLANAARGT